MVCWLLLDYWINILLRGRCLQVVIVDSTIFSLLSLLSWMLRWSSVLFSKFASMSTLFTICRWCSRSIILGYKHTISRILYRSCSRWSLLLICRCLSQTMMDWLRFGGHWRCPTLIEIEETGAWIRCSLLIHIKRLGLSNAIIDEYALRRTGSFLFLSSSSSAICGSRLMMINAINCTIWSWTVLLLLLSYRVCIRFVKTLSRRCWRRIRIHIPVLVR